MTLQTLQGLLQLVLMGLLVRLFWSNRRMGKRIEQAIADYDTALTKWERGTEQRLARGESQLAAFHKRNDVIVEQLEGWLKKPAPEEPPRKPLPG
jgi:hypothetical protein